MDADSTSEDISDTLKMQKDEQTTGLMKSKDWEGIPFPDNQDHLLSYEGGEVENVNRVIITSKSPKSGTTKSLGNSSNV